MKKDLTELVFILDRSGSMGGLEDDTIGGFNAMLAKQKAVDGECNITTVLFDNRYKVLHDRINLKAVSPITDKEYSVGGSTALNDAIGRTIHKIANVQKHTAEDYRAEKVMVVIITDGAENASSEYSGGQVRQLIDKQKSQYGWEFIFLGANIDAIEAASMFGIGADRAQSYVADGLGIELNFSAVSKAASRYRRASRVDENWKSEIEDDYRERNGNKK